MLKKELQKILVIDDEEMVCNSLQVLLESIGYSVITAENGDVGIDLYLSEKPDLVLTDIKMPKKSGFQVCEYIHHNNPDFPIIVLSGVRVLEQAMQALRLGGWDFLTKPILNFELIEHSINKAFERSKLLHENKKYKAYLEATIEERTNELDMEKSTHKVTKAKLKTLFENINDQVYLISEGLIVDCNKAAEIFLEKDKYYIVGNSIWDYLEEIHPDTSSSEKYIDMFGLAYKGYPQTIELITTSKDGKQSYFELSLSNLVENDENYLLMILKDVTSYKEAQERLHKLSLTVEQSHSAIIITNIKGIIEYVNTSFVEITGYDFDDVIGKSPSIISSGKMSNSFYQDLWSSITSGNVWHGELINKKKNGDYYWGYTYITPIKNSSGKIINYVANSEDITARKKYEQKLLKQANFDNLTGLPNRLLAMDRLTQDINEATRQGYEVILMIANIDKIKDINDTLGHSIGDELIKEVSKRLISAVRKEDAISRFGGDEFLIVIKNMEVINECIADKIINIVEKPFYISGHELFITVTIGVSIYPRDSSDSYTLLKNADSAMHKAKQQGRNKYCFFSNDINESALRRFRIESKLRHALDNNEISLNFQPKIEISTGRVTGAETLMRWNNKELGSIPPDIFIPVAESTGLIHSLSKYMMSEACSHAKKWKEILGKPINLAVNVSSMQFKDANLAELIVSILDKNSIDPLNFEIEITENLFIENMNEVITILEKMSRKGISISVDDFGTGFSSLSYLKKFPVDKLKIDRSFIMNLPKENDENALVKAIIAMGHSLELEIIAEGVETEEQLDFLKQLGCNTVQGYYYSHPLNGDDFIKFVRENHEIIS